MNIRNYYYNIRGDFYEKICFPELGAVLKTLSIKQDFLTTDINIFYKNGQFNSSPQECLKKFGKPNYKIIKIDYIIFIYKEKILNHKIYVQFHFINNELKIITQTVFDTDNDWKKLILNTIAEKYKINSAFSKIQSDTIIKDSHSNIILISNSVHLNVVYVSDQTKTIDVLTSYLYTIQQLKTANRSSIKEILKDKF